jgi:hypothetical protein
MFKMNAGSLDRALRALIGLGLIALVYVGPQTPWGWLGLIPLGTAAMGWCPLYAIFGLSTCKAAPAAK